MSRKCKDCDSSIDDRNMNAVRCLPCGYLGGRPRLASPDRVRNYSMKRNIVDGVIRCLDCDDPFSKSLPRKGNVRMRCDMCSWLRQMFLGVFSGQQNAAREIGTAKREGHLRPASEFACVDCEKPAYQYDHRDYGRPLDVVPVCRSCNVIRGPAKPINSYIVYSLLGARLSELVTEGTTA